MKIKHSDAYSLPRLHETDRPILFVLEDGYLRRAFSLFDDIKNRKEKGEIFGPIYVVCAFDVQGGFTLSCDLNAYLNNATINEVHLCPSLRRHDIDVKHDLVTIHEISGLRVLLSSFPFAKMKDPYIVLIGGKRFCNEYKSIDRFLSRDVCLDIDEVLVDQKADSYLGFATEIPTKKRACS